MSTTPPSVEAAAAMQALLNGPAAKPPPGVLPNFVDPHDISAAVIAVMSTCLIVTFLVLSIRSYTKLRLMHSVACEDCTLIVPHPQYPAVMITDSHLDVMILAWVSTSLPSTGILPLFLMLMSIAGTSSLYSTFNSQLETWRRKAHVGCAA